MKHLLQSIAIKLISSIEVWTDIVKTELVNRIVRNYFPNVEFKLFDINNQEYISYSSYRALAIVIITKESNIYVLEHLLDTKDILLVITTSKKIKENYKHRVSVLLLDFVKS